MTLLRGAGLDDAGRWHVPSDYNVVTDAVDSHARDAVAMIFATPTSTARAVTWGEIQDLSCRIARMLIDNGVERHDVVGVVMPQTVEAAAACIGVLRAGGTLLCMSALWGDDELLQRFQVAGCKTALADAATTERLSRRNQGPRALLVDVEALSVHDPTHMLVEVRPDDPAHMYFTSGTTGPPKALVHANRNLIGHNEFEICHGLRPGDVFFGAGEWAWSQAKLLGPWRHGAVQFVFSSPRFDPDRLFSAISDAGVTSALVNPTMLKIVRAKLSPNVAKMPWHFRTVCSSNEPLAPDLGDWFAETFGCRIREYYGLTESYPMIGYRVDEPVHPGAAGRPLPGWEVELHDELGDSVGVADEGEACLRASTNPQYPLGYLVDSEVDNAPFDQEWFRTGDMFRRDADDYWHFVGRRDDVIKSSGYRVGPYELENVLEGHAAVSEAAVVGLPDPDRGQVICAFVVRSIEAASVPTDELVKQLQQHVREKHSVFAYPRELVFVDELPKSSTGKVQRALLRRTREGESQ